MPSYQREYLKRLIAARIEAQTGSAPKDLEKLSLMLDFTDRDKPFYTDRELRLMLADPARRRRVYSVVLKLSLLGKPENNLIITPTPSR